MTIKPKKESSIWAVKIMIIQGKIGAVSYYGIAVLNTINV
jgi:hypothetical protein